MKGQKLTFFTSDWHLGHSASIEYDNRPFTDIEHMHRVIVNNFNATVPPGSVTYVLGDTGYTNGTLIADLVKQMNGTKILILGNHDAGVNAMYAKGFDAVMHGAVLYIAQQRVTLSHCPLKGIWRENTEGMKGAKPGDPWHGSTKQHRFTTTDEGQFHLHGHVHSPNGGKSVKILGKQRDVGVVGNNYRPVSISEIESWIAKYGR